MTLSQSVTQVLAGVTIIAQLLSLFLLISLVIFYSTRKSSRFFILLKKYSFWLALLVTLVATSGSLYYSEVAGYEPCQLCWWQRIFMYPQVILFTVALAQKRTDIADYSLVLSALGGLIAGYHYFSQMTGISFSSCAAIGYSVSCSQRFFLEFNYITIPLMSFSAFVLVFLLMFLQKIKLTDRWW